MNIPGDVDEAIAANGSTHLEPIGVGDKGGLKSSVFGRVRVVGTATGGGRPRPRPQPQPQEAERGKRSVTVKGMVEREAIGRGRGRCCRNNNHG